MEPQPVNGGRRSVSQTLLVGTRLPNSRAKTTARKPHHTTESYECCKESKGRDAGVGLREEFSKHTVSHRGSPAAADRGRAGT